MKSPAKYTIPVKNRITRTLPLLRGMFIYPEALKRRDIRLLRSDNCQAHNQSREEIALLAEA